MGKTLSDLASVADRLEHLSFNDFPTPCFKFFEPVGWDELFESFHLLFLTNVDELV
jgi:hypothetical protein